MNAPLVSVVIGARCVEPFLAAALQSVLAQEHRPLQVIVADDASTDRTREVALAFGPPVEVVSGAYGSAAAARNAGLERARGEVIAFLDGDDAWLPGSLDGRLAYLCGHPGLDYVVGRLRAVPDPPGSWPSWAPALWREHPLVWHIGAFVGWRAPVERVGGFDPSFAVAEDLDWFARLRDAGVRGEQIALVCGEYRLRADSTSGFLQAQHLGARMRVLHAAVRRRRNARVNA